MRRWLLGALLLGACSASGPDIPACIEALGTDGQVPAFTALDHSQEAAVFAALLEGTHHQRAKVRAQCARLLGRKKDITAINPLRAMLHDKDGSTRTQAARSLAVLADPEQMLEWLQDEQQTVPARSALAGALVDEQIDEVLPLLTRWLEDPRQSLPLRLGCTCALLRAGRRAEIAAVAWRVAERAENDLELRGQALELFGNHAGEAAVTKLTPKLGDPADRLREGALAGLGRARVPGAIPLLLEAARDRTRSTSSRLIALRMVAEQEKTPASTGLLVDSLRDPDWRVRRQAASLLPCFKHEAGVKKALQTAREGEWDDAVARELDRTLRQVDCR